jgi:hypothetical protein
MASIAGITRAARTARAPAQHLLMVIVASLISVSVIGLF